jgi:uncharacterized protein
MWKLMKWFVALTGVYAFGSAGVGWYVTSTYKPTLPRDKGTLGFIAEDVEVRSADGVKLRGWYAPGPPGAPAVALFHGHNGSRQEMLPIARALAVIGYDLLLVDFRGCGESGGDLQTLGVKEALDVAACLQFLTDARPHARRRIGVVALGTGASAVVLAHQALKDCGGAVLIAPYDTLEQAFDHRMRQKIGVGISPVGELASQVVAWRVGSPLREVRPIDVISKLAPCPVYLVGAAGDSTTPASELQGLYQRAAQPKELYIVPNITRTRLTDLYQSLLRAKLIDFFEDCLR